MSEYYLQVFQNSDDFASLQDRVAIDELPYQTLIIERLSALGVIDLEDRMIPTGQIDRVAKILRLQTSLEVNLSGAAIICELLDRLEKMEEEIKQLKSL